MCTRIHVYVYACMYACMYACVYVCMHACMHMYVKTTQKKMQIMRHHIRLFGLCACKKPNLSHLQGSTTKKKE